MLTGHSSWVCSVAFSHDSKLLASALDDETVEVWDVATGYRAFSFDISPSGSTVAIGCQSGKVLVIGFSLAILSTLR
jgi:WD40 repeat protein